MIEFGGGGGRDPSDQRKAPGQMDRDLNHHQIQHLSFLFL